MKSFLNSPEGQVDDFFFTPNGKILHGLLSGELRTFSLQSGKVATTSYWHTTVDPIAQDKSGRIFTWSKSQSITPDSMRLTKQKSPV